MTRTEDQLRAALHQRADRIAAPIDVFTGVEARAKRMHRDRVAAAVGAAVAAVVAVAVVVPTVVAGPHHHRTPTVGPSPTTATTSKSPTPTPTPSGSSQVLSPSAPWPYRGDQKVKAGLATFAAAWSAKHAGSTLEPLFGEIYEPSGQPEIIFVSRGGDAPRWGFAVKSQDGVDFIIDQPLKPGSTQLVAAVPGDETLRLLAVAAPTVKTFQYAPDGVNYQDMYLLAPGVAVKALEGDPAKDRVRVVGDDGTVLYDGPAPDTPAASS